ncbi:LPS-assembly protein LptD [Ottowia testudinis]|uniref:LPS-assembly protein LptD n=1 Tax=Ottowia testudinis TaxID=2816950 RepID=A0A975H4T8_9BURK|nr:LPS-assembly protein LptD [Ottowia testudinis]
MTDASRPARAVLCPVALGVLALLAGPAWGQTVEPLTLRASPLLAEKLPSNAKPASLVLGDHISGRTDLETVIEGNAELRQPGLVARGDKLVYDQTTDVLTASGGVRLNREGDRYTATSGQIKVDAVEGFFLQPTYEFIANGAHGHADRLELLDRDRSTVFHGTYTTCQREDGASWRPDWMLRADRLELDREDGEGRAEGAVLEFKGVPILPLPSMSFPLDERRKSGWLPPTIGLDNKSGLNLAVPYYWNIAPNRDATVIPTVMVRRGVGVQGEFRYLENNYNGRANVNFMPNDRLRGGRNRWGYFVRHNGQHDTGIAAIGNIGLGLNLNRVSDNDYWRDFNRNGLALTTRLLANDGALSWGRGDFSASLRALKWQTLQDVNAPIVPPYDRLPQLAGRWGRVNDRGFDYSIDADFTRFRADRFWTNEPNADRGVLHGQLARPFTRPWGFLTPKAQLHATAYRFDGPLDDGRTSASRVLPTFSLDGGLAFERDARFFGRAFTQTLEPRLKYVYTPYRDQSLLPNYDSGAYDFNFATIWADNAFAGHDRVVDNNLITAGLTTRLLDPGTGAEAVRLAIAQRYRFSGQQVVLPGGTPTAKGWSDIMLGAGINWDPRWAFDGVVQYNPDSRQNTRTLLQARYSPGPFRTVSLAYRHQRDLNSQYVDLGWQWPLGALIGRGSDPAPRRASGGGSCQGDGRWYSVGRMNYSMQERRLVDGILGLEYDAGCWIGRVVAEKLNSSVNSSTKRVMFQIELIGLSRLGTNPLSALRNNIPRYQVLGADAPPPSRFTEYE